MVRLIALPLLALAAPAVAQMVPIEPATRAPAQLPDTTPLAPEPAPTNPTAPTPVPSQLAAPAAPIMLPQLSTSQETYLTKWLQRGLEQGVATTTASATPALSGDALVRAVLDRARALRTGRIGSGDFLEIWALRPAAYDPLPAFAAAVAGDRLPQWAGALTPPYAGYDSLRLGLATYEGIRDAGGWPTVDAKTMLKVVRARLALEDKTVTESEKLVPAIQRAQRRYGLNPTGLLDARTLAALNVPVQARIDAIMANMERWRWLPRELPVNRVQVNIAAAVLTVFEGDVPVTSMRAVTGRPTNETPMLQSSIHSIVINPPWNVPASIAKRELWPKGRVALAAQGYKIVGTPETGERIVQPAGPNSALGHLKFDFDNPFAVYLHDTPARAKFTSFDRLASHGCVRLEKPVPLAELFLRDDPQWAGQVQAAIDSEKTQRVQLPKRIAVYLLYWTAFASSNGTMNFRDDPYGWDKVLAGKIDASSKRAAATLVAFKE